MKKFRTIACVLLVLLMLMMAGCGAQDEWEAAKKAANLLSGITEDPQLRTDTETFLNALITEDFESAYNVVSQAALPAEFLPVYEELVPVLRQIDRYELLPSYIGKNVTNGVSTTSVRYMMTAGEQRFFVEVTRADGYDGLISFYLNEYQPVITTGTLGNMQGANVLQWIFLIVGMLEIVFALCVFVDCCRHKMRRKWLWLLIIALGYMIFSLIATPEQFRVGVNVGAFLNYTSLIRYSTGGFVLRIMIPAGAIIYLICRKTLFAKYAQFQQQKAMEVQPVVPADEVPQTLGMEAEIPEPEKTEE